MIESLGAFSLVLQNFLLLFLPKYKIVLALTLTQALSKSTKNTLKKVKVIIHHKAGKYFRPFAAKIPIEKSAMLCFLICLLQIRSILDT